MNVRQDIRDQLREIDRAIVRQHQPWLRIQLFMKQKTLVDVLALMTLAAGEKPNDQC